MQMEPDATKAANELSESLLSVDRLIQAGQMEAAEARCRQLAQRFPQTGEVWLRLGYVLLAKNDSVAAGDALHRGAQLQSSNAALWTQLSIAPTARGWAPKPRMPPAVQSPSTRPKPATGRRWATRWPGNTAGTKRRRRCGSRSPSIRAAAAVWNTLAEAELKLGRLSAAKQSLEQALALVPRNLGAIANYAFLLCQLGQRDQATEWLRRWAGPHSAAS